jgi:hypothetical protein
MNNYLFFLGVLLVGLGLFVRFKLQNNFKTGSENFKKSRSVSYILLGIGIICVCFYFILDPYNTFPQLKGWSKILLAGTIYLYICFVVPYLIQRKINKIYKKKRKFGFGFDTPKEYFKIIYIGITSGGPILISLLYLIFNHLKIFPEFTFTMDQFLNVTLGKSESNFIFLIYGFIFAPLAFIAYGAVVAYYGLTILYIVACGYFWDKKIRDMEWIIKLMYVVAAFAIYFIIYESILGDYLATE